ncbi:hypothetical protein QBC33DRAFT_548570 [Phialemonium atrogriseum]|uniref:GPI inositol-deacylase n=1 Tax=Phialemonium atrogriseum TaxID=1093897 RepID=A0AAJ0FJ56_9PEZI|nr:uncharacterized protein QBC33DRAFT_548570 [Phialemonium atrogriseum]KAK1764024.1 hypothetical protein QBC33DRAFT_548570 [Phialemonium atrogriseum]
MTISRRELGGQGPSTPRPARGAVRVDVRSPVTALSSIQGIPGLDDGKSTASATRFTSSWTRNRHDKDDEEGARGPIGLRLLHSSPAPLIDLIFVHGLRGGSIKTWRKGNDPRCFWPQFWLPMEPAFEHASIHSFGYDSDWASSTPSILNIHDFGQVLLEEMRNSPSLRDKGERPIILIGHSMGGLVIKKAFILAQNVPDFKNRVRCIFFLATPHRGSGHAATLNNLLTVSGIMSSRHYLADLATGSTSIQLINDDFERCAHDLPIFTFYETLGMLPAISSALIVEKNSAILGRGYKNERVQYVHANHRDICKFESPNDHNYVTVKNALACAVEDLLIDVSATKREESREQMTTLRSFLGVPASPDEHHQGVEGSCRWIEARDDFQDWRDCAEEVVAEALAETGGKNLSIFWVHANPGTGKTVLTSHVISHLREFQLECAYHYFHVGDKASQSLGPFLRSMCYQMAMSNPVIRENLLKLCYEGASFDLDDFWAIWTKVFRKGILQARVHTPQYWVIDAMDESHKYQEFFTMLRGENPAFPLRIFMTSRNIHDMQRLQQSLESSASLFCIEIPVQDTINDIRSYIQSRIDSLPLGSFTDREELAINILDKSNACFLWVRLVLDELENVYSSESITKVLERIPGGMLPYYERTVKAMTANTLEKHIAKAVLVWTVASARKLTISELSVALKLDINTALPSAKIAVEGLCGQLVSVDNDSGLVDLIHPTAREFLLSEAAGEFMVSKPAAHERIALTCLKLLSRGEMRRPRNRPISQIQRQSEASPFLGYALMQFPEHIYAPSSKSDELLFAMDRFFKSNVLSWIERLALNDNLHCLVRASKNLRAYLSRRPNRGPGLSSQLRNIDGWSTDLSRLVTQFGDALSYNPSSIYLLIPPLCPSGSSIYQQFGKRPDSLSVVGVKNNAWDDCVAYVGFGDDVAVAVSCGENLIAVGMESGDVNLYNHRSYQKEGFIHHKHPVDLVHLTDRFIAICTTKAIVFQELDGNTIWESRLRFRCLLLTSSDDSIIAISQHGHLLRWDKMSGALLEDQNVEYRNYDVPTMHNGLVARAPHVASISPDMEMLALGYRGGSVCLWDIREAELTGWARDEAGRLAAKVLFNPDPNINLLLVIYTDHGLALYETWSGNLVRTHTMPNEIGLLSAACSPDGRTLVTTDTRGNMHIWDFESLSVLYHVLSPFPSFRILNFTSDGSSVVDVMDSAMRIWSPAVLVRKNLEEDASTSDDAIQLAVTEGAYESHKNATIMTLCSHPSLPVVFAGKYNSQVVAFGTKGEKPTTVLYSHSQTAFVMELAISRNDIIASSDVAGVVQVRKLESSTMKIELLLAEIHMTAKVKQLCFSADGEYLLVGTTSSDHVYRVIDGSCVGSWAFDKHERKTWRWLLLPHEDKEKQHFTLLMDGVIRRYNAQSFPAPLESPEIRLQYDLDEGDVETGINTAVVSTSTRTLVLEVRHHSNLLMSSSTMFLFDLSKVPPPATGSPSDIILKPLSDVLPKHCKHFVGFSEPTKSIVFVHQNSWISSIDLPSLEEKRYTQHFFVPKDYLAGSSGAEGLPVKTVGDDVVFCLHGELIAVKNGLTFREVKALE